MTAAGPGETDRADDELADQAAAVLRGMAEHGIRIDDRAFERFTTTLLAEYDRRGTEIERLRKGWSEAHLDGHRDQLRAAQCSALCSDIEHERDQLLAEHGHQAERIAEMVGQVEAQAGEIERLRARTHELQERADKVNAPLQSEVDTWRNRYQEAKRWTEDAGWTAEWAHGEHSDNPFWGMTSYNAKSTLLRLVTERDQLRQQRRAALALIPELARWINACEEVDGSILEPWLDQLRAALGAADEPTTGGGSDA